MTDPYSVLGIGRDATDEEIKKAYRAASRRYHPDANLENPKWAEEKFKEVQQAYKEIMNERSGGASRGAGSHGGDAWSGGSGGWNYGDFWGFGGYGRARRGTYAQYTENDSPQMKAAANYINQGYYREAIRILNEMPDKDGKWYYFSAMANFGAGNIVIARQFIDRAIQLEPGNPDYRQYKMQMEDAGSWYEDRQSRYGRPDFTGNSLCLRLCMLNLICNCCCGGSGFCCGSPYGM